VFSVPHCGCGFAVHSAHAQVLAHRSDEHAAHVQVLEEGKRCAGQAHTDNSFQYILEGSVGYLGV